MKLNKKSSLIKHSAGFSLAEILLSLVIISVGTIGVGKLYASMISGSSDSNNRFQAATFAEAKLESLRFSHKVGDNIIDGSEVLTKGNNTYDISWTSTALGRGQSSIKTTVKWQNRNGEYTDNTTVSLSSISSPVSASLRKLSPPVAPAFDLVVDKCNILKDNLWVGSSGAYGSSATSTTSCAAGGADTGSS